MTIASVRAQVHVSMTALAGATPLGLEHCTAALTIIFE